MQLALCQLSKCSEVLEDFDSLTCTAAIEASAVGKIAPGIACIRFCRMSPRGVITTIRQQASHFTLATICKTFRLVLPPPLYSKRLAHREQILKSSSSLFRIYAFRHQLCSYYSLRQRLILDIGPSLTRPRDSMIMSHSHSSDSGAKDPKESKVIHTENTRDSRVQVEKDMPQALVEVSRGQLPFPLCCCGSLIVG